MPDKLFGDLRDRIPQLASVDDDYLVVTLGNNYPGLLENPDNKEFADRYKYLTEGGNPLTTAARGFAAGIIDVGTAIYSLDEAAATKSGDKEAAARAGEMAEFQKAYANRVAGPGANRFSSKLGRAGASIVPVVAAGAAGTGAVLTVAGLQSMGAVYRNAVDSYKAAGVDEDKARDDAFAPALASGIITAGITYGGGKLADLFKTSRVENIAQILKTPEWKDATSKVVQMYADTSVKASAGRVARSIGVEGFEEGLDEFISGYGVAKQTYNPNLTLEDAIKQSIEAFVLGGLVGLPISTVQEYGARLAKIENLAETAPLVAQKQLEKLQQEAEAAKQQAQEAPQEAPDRAFAEANKDVPMGGRRPVSELPLDPLEQLEQEVLDEQPDLTVEQEEELERLSKEEIDNEERQAAPEAPADPSPEPVAETTAPEPTPEPVEQEEGSPFSQEDRKQQAIAKIKTLLKPLAGTTKQMRKSGGFVFYGRAGDSNKKVGDPNRTVLPTKTLPQYEKKLNNLIDEANKLAETLEPDPAKRREFRDSLIEDAKQQIFTAPKSKRGSKTTANIDKAEQKVLQSPEGQEDILDLWLDYNRNVIELPRQGRNYQTDSKVLNSDSYSGPYKAFIDAVNTLVARSNNLGSTFKKVPAKQWEQTRISPEDLYRILLGPNAEGRDIRGEDFWEALTEAVQKRIARFDSSEQESVPFGKAVTTKSEDAKRVTAKDVSVDDTFNSQGRTYRVIEVGEDKGNLAITAERLGAETEAEAIEGPVAETIVISPEGSLYVDKYDKAPEEQISGVDSTPVEDPNVPFAAIPPVTVRGVTIEGARNEKERQLMQRAIDLLPLVQRKLGGAKVSRIFINRTTKNPGASGARNGDFGTIYLSPEGVELAERDGATTLERIMIEEIIHNYTGLAIYHDWNKRKRPGTFKEYYAAVFTRIHDQMTPRQRQEAVFYYTGLTDESGQFAGDKVGVAEEGTRILFSRALTGEFTEQNFKWGKQLPKQSPLAKLIEMLRRFWNGIQAGLMTNSPSISALKNRFDRLLGDTQMFYDRIDTPETVLIGSSQYFLNFGSSTDAEAEAKSKPENGFNDNEGQMLSFQYRKSQLEFFSQENVTLDERPDSGKNLEQSVEEVLDAVDGDFAQKLFALAEIDLFDLSSRVLGKVETVSGSDAAYIQRQNTDASLTDQLSGGFHEAVHEYLASRTDIPDNFKSQAFYYVWSRISNKARTYGKKNGVKIVSKETLKPQKGKKSFPEKGYLNSFTKDFKRLIKSRTTTATKFNPKAVQVDAMVGKSEGDPIATYELVANPNAEVPTLEILNAELLETIQKLANSNLLSSEERSILKFGYDLDFEYGWKTAYQKMAGIKKSTFSMQYSQMLSKLATELALDQREMLNDALRHMTPATRKIALERIDEMFGERKAKEEARIAAAERAKTAQRDANRVEKAGRVGKFLTKQDSMEMLREAVQPGGKAYDLDEAKKRMQETKRPKQDDFTLVGSALPPDSRNNILNEAGDTQERAALNYRDPNPTTEVNETVVINEEAQKRIEEASDASKPLFTDLREKVIKRAEEVIKGFRQYEHLDPKQYGSVIEVLRQFEDTGQVAEVKANQYLAGVTDGLSDGQLAMFRNVLIFRDLKQSIDAGLYDNIEKQLPFNLTKDEVMKQVEAHEIDVEKDVNIKVKEALGRRNKLLNSITKRLKNLKLLPDKINDAEDYFHRAIIEYQDAARADEADPTKASTLAQGFRSKKASFQKRRKGSDKDYVTDYATAESAVVTQAYAQILTNARLNELKNLVDVKPTFVRMANDLNKAKLSDMNISPEELYAEQNKGIGKGFGILKSLVKQQKLRYNSKFEEVVEALSEDSVAGEPPMSHPDMFLFLQHLIEIKSNGAPAAALIFKNIQAKKKALKNILGERYETWEKVAAKSPTHTTWQPEKGNFLYRGSVVSDNVLEKWVEESDGSDEITLTKEQLRRGLILGGKKSTWVIPNEVAQQLNEFKAPESSKLGGWYRDALANWKFWKLFNPWGFFKYELNNTTGDLDIAFAYDPEILKGTRQAWNDLWEFHVNKKPLNEMPDLEMMLEKGVIGSGYQVQDLADQKVGTAYEGLIGDYLTSTSKKSNWWKKYKKGVSTLNQIREDTLRVAAFRYFQNKLDTSSNVYGVSNPQALAQITNKNDKAAKLSRELIGDYGAISRNGRWIRSNAIPFYSWMEINLPRYVRLMRNSRFEDSEGTTGRVVKVGAKKTAISATKAAFLASSFSLAVNMWNRAMIGLGLVDEDDKEVLEARKQQHLLLYSTEEGRVISVRFQGALTDALEYFGLGNVFETATDVVFTEETISSALDQYVAEKGYIDGINRTINSLTPFLKTPAEVVFKQRLYPNVLQTSPMRDRAEYFLQSFEMGPLTFGINSGYRLMKAFPTKGMLGGGSVMRDMINMIGYTTDTGEAAYQYIKAKEYDFIKEKGDERPAFTTTSKNDALYYHKKALKFGDERSAKRWLAEYERLGGSKKGLKRSVSLAEPLAKVSKSDRKEFLDSLTNTEKDILGRAESWYEDTFK